MSCDSVGKLIPLYFYGELPPDEEERLEDHLHGCVACTREMERQRQFAAALDRREAEVPPFFLEECRADLFSALQSQSLQTPVLPTQLLATHPLQSRDRQGAVLTPPKSPWALFLEAMAATLGGFTRLRQPLGAMALIALGFVAARFAGMNPGVAQKAPAASPSEDVYATVRSVQADGSGGVKIAFDETRRRELAGRMDDQNIQRMLLAAAREDNPAVRVESVDALKTRAGSTEVRDALLNALVNDPAAPVRMKALEGLKPLAGDPQVRTTLAHVVLADDYPAIRMQAVDLLVAHPDDSVVGVFQGLVQREKDPYMRLKFEKALKDWNASIGTF